MEGLVVEVGVAVGVCPVAVVQEGEVDDADVGGAMVQEADGDAPGWEASDKGAGAVKWVECPEKFMVECLMCLFFSDDAVIGVVVVDAFNEHVFDGNICICDPATIGFAAAGDVVEGSTGDVASVVGPGADLCYVDVVHGGCFLGSGVRARYHSPAGVVFGCGGVARYGMIELTVADYVC